MNLSLSRSRCAQLLASCLLAIAASSPTQAASWVPWDQLAPTAATGPTDGFNVLIADRGNNRLLIVGPDKRITWEYDFHNLPRDAGADDAFFADGGRSIIVNLEHYQLVQIIDIASKSVVWSYGVGGKRGSAPGLLNYPDDAYQLPDGNIVVADIRNCRIVEISPDKQIVRQYGKSGRCSGPQTLSSPNGDKPLPDGHILISTIGDHALTELDAGWSPVFRMVLPLHYPSDPQMTGDGTFLIADYVRPGRIIEIDRQGRVVWDYSPTSGDAELKRPSLALELPNGNVIANDDLNDRVVVIDKASKQIIWQYGVTAQPGSQPGHLSIPDGLDLQRIDGQ